MVQSSSEAFRPSPADVPQDRGVQGRGRPGLVPPRQVLEKGRGQVCDGWEQLLDDRPRVQRRGRWGCHVREGPMLRLI